MVTIGTPATHTPSIGDELLVEVDALRPSHPGFERVIEERLGRVVATRVMFGHLYVHVEIIDEAGSISKGVRVSVYFGTV